MDPIINKDSNGMYSSLHDSYALIFNGYIARIMEYEVYDLSDPYTHGSERQVLYDISGTQVIPSNDRSLCPFYIHRSKKGMNDPYKGGSFKGIDIIVHGGILIRSILVVTPYRDDVKHLAKIDPKYGGTLIEGPSLTVDHMCALSGWSLPELETHIRLVKCKWSVKSASNICLGSRVGLTMKRAPTDDMYRWAKHMVAPLRSSIFIPTKSRCTFFASDINRVDVPLGTDRYRKEYNQGIAMDHLSVSMTQLQVAGYLSTHR